MKTPLDKKEENKNQHVNNETTQKKSSSQPTSQLGDKRPEVIAQRKLQEKAANSAQVKQLNVFQNMVNNSPRMTEQVQLKSSKENTPSNIQEQPIQQKKNKTGLPDNLKSGVENLSGISMDDVKVHYNSSKPAQLQAHAYAQGNNIHLGPGQEKHLPHEAWHVVQQKQGRVQPTKQMKSKVNINDDAGLEREADVMGAKALQAKSKSTNLTIKNTSSQTIQQVKDKNKRPEIDTRVLDLKKETESLLKELLKEGPNWEAQYEKEGQERAEKYTEKKLSRQKGESWQSKFEKKVLKELWSSLSREDQLKMFGMATGAVVGIATAAAVGLGKFISKAVKTVMDSTGSGNKEKKEAEKPKDSSWLDNIDDDTIRALYNAYKIKRNVSNKIEKAEGKIIETIGGFGKSVGKAIGGIRNDWAFSGKMGKIKPQFHKDRKELESIMKIIRENEDTERYSEITEVLEYVFNGGYNSNLYLIHAIEGANFTKEGMKEYEAECYEFLLRLQESKIDYDESVVDRLVENVKKKFGKD